MERLLREILAAELSDLLIGIERAGVRVTLLPGSAASVTWNVASEHEAAASLRSAANITTRHPELLSLVSPDRLRREDGELHLMVWAGGVPPLIEKLTKPE